MRNWLGRIRGAVLMGLAWGVAWAPLGVLLGWFVDRDGSMDEMWVAVGAYPGFLSVPHGRWFGLFMRPDRCKERRDDLGDRARMFPMGRMGCARDPRGLGPWQRGGELLHRGRAQHWSVSGRRAGSPAATN